MTTCKDCGVTWDGTTRLCHCAKCHRTYGGIEPFDEHQWVTCAKKTCTPENPCDNLTRKHYSTGKREVHCRETGLECPVVGGKVRCTEPAAGGARDRPRGGAPAPPQASADEEDDG